MDNNANGFTANDIVSFADQNEAIRRAGVVRREENVARFSVNGVRVVEVTGSGQNAKYSLTRYYGSLDANEACQIIAGLLEALIMTGVLSEPCEVYDVLYSNRPLEDKQS